MLANVLSRTVKFSAPLASSFGLASPSVRMTSLPDYTTGVSVVGLYTGLQQRFADRGRIVFRIGQRKVHTLPHA